MSPLPSSSCSSVHVKEEMAIVVVGVVVVVRNASQCVQYWGHSVTVILSLLSDLVQLNLVLGYL